MAKETCTHQDIARDLGVSVTTVKSYRRKFPGFMPVAAKGKPLRFPLQTLDVCRTIRDLFADGLSIEAVSKKLASRFPSDSKSDNLSISQAPPLSEPLAAKLDEVLAALRSKDPGQSESGDLAVRVQALEAALGEVRQAQEKLLAGQEEIAGRLRALHEQAAASRAEARRVVTVRGADGKRDTYELGGAARQADASRTQSRTPPEEFTALPVVVRSERGEFLGVTDKAGRAFTLAQFEAYLLNRAGLGAGNGAWKGGGETWDLAFGGEGPEGHRLGFARTRTQRGNLVALFHRLEVGGKAMSDTFRTAFFRQIKESFDH